MPEHHVVGPPGCGKTRYLSDQAPLAAAKYGASRVVIASLTRAAAHEIGSRVDGLPKQNVGTLHALCYRGLERPALAETADGAKLWNAKCRPAWRIDPSSSLNPESAAAETPNWTGEGDRLLAAMQTLRARMEPREAWPPFVRTFAQDWEAWKAHATRMDFTDLIEQGIERLPVCPGDPAVLMVDEAQDMSALEMALLRQWAAKAEQLVIVGDPDQSLYTWRGATPEIVFDGGDTYRVLEQSYRVPRAVVDYSLRWIERVPERREVVYRPTDVEGEVRRLAVRWQNPKPLLEAFREDLEAQRSIMVLASCGYMLQPLISMLRHEGLPFWNPYRVTQGAWNPMRGARRLLCFLRPSGAAWPGEARVWTWDDVRRWSEPLMAKGTLSRGFKAYVEEKCREDRFGESRADEAVPWPEFLDLLEEEARLPAANLDVEWWRNAHLASKRKGCEYPLRVLERYGPQALHDEPKIIVGTIHSVKGGESDSVYVWPDLSKAAMKSVPGGRVMSDAATLRQFYVAFTRARKKLTLLAPTSSDAVAFPRP